MLFQQVYDESSEVWYWFLEMTVVLNSSWGLWVPQKTRPVWAQKRKQNAGCSYTEEFNISWALTWIWWFRSMQHFLLSFLLKNFFFFFFLRNNCLCSSHVFVQTSLLHWTWYEIVHSSVRSHLKISPGSTDAINIHFDRLENMVAFSKSTIWDDFVLIVQHCWCWK